MKGPVVPRSRAMGINLCPLNEVISPQTKIQNAKNFCTHAVLKFWVFFTNYLKDYGNSVSRQF
jgi:hypothetical protein